MIIQVIMPLEADILYGKGWSAFWAGERCEVKINGGRKAVKGWGWTVVSVEICR